MPNLPPALRADALTELRELMAFVQHRETAAAGEARCQDVNDTMHETPAMREARAAYANAYRALADAAAAYRATIRRAVDHLEGSR